MARSRAACTEEQAESTPEQTQSLSALEGAANEARARLIAETRRLLSAPAAKPGKRA